MTPVFKKEDSSLLKIYRPVSALLIVSKIYERIIQKKILKYIDKIYLPTYVDVEKDAVHKWS